MNDYQKVIFKQLQLSGVGMIVIIFGLFDTNTAYIIAGICIALFGVGRALLIGKLIKQDEQHSESDY